MGEALAGRVHMICERPAEAIIYLRDLALRRRALEAGRAST